MSDDWRVTSRRQGRDPDRGSSRAAGPGGASGAGTGVRGVVASRVAAMASAGSMSSNGGGAGLGGAIGGAGGGPAAAGGGVAGEAKMTSSSYGVDSNSRIPSYRLSSLDRLAQRQRLFEAQPVNGTAAAALHTDTSVSSALLSNVSLVFFLVLVLVWSHSFLFWRGGGAANLYSIFGFGFFRVQFTILIFNFRFGARFGLVWFSVSFCFLSLTLLLFLNNYNLMALLLLLSNVSLLILVLVWSL